MVAAAEYNSTQVSQSFFRKYGTKCGILYIIAQTIFIEGKRTRGLSMKLLKTPTMDRLSSHGYGPRISARLQQSIFHGVRITEASTYTITSEERSQSRSKLQVSPYVEEYTTASGDADSSYHRQFGDGVALMGSGDGRDKPHGSLRIPHSRCRWNRR